MTTTATMWINPAKNLFETVTLLRQGTKANGWKHWTRVRRADGSETWVPNNRLSRCSDRSV